LRPTSTPSSSSTLAPIDDEFFSTAGLILPVTIDLAHSPEQVWATLGSDRMGEWMSVLDRAEWLSPRPLRPGSKRTVRLMRAITVLEDWYVWDEPHRATFRAESISLPVVSGWAEDFRLQRLPDGGTRLHYVMALDSRLLRLIKIPNRLRPAITRFNERLMGKITTIMPAPSR
jgi:Polyketide cyclase / dehydrase and lipid transport